MKHDFEYITKYILEYDSGIPPVIFIGIIIFVCSVILILYYTKINDLVFIRQSSVFLFLGYVFLVFCTTILFRGVSDEMKYTLCPFGSYVGLDNKKLAQNILNIILFIPIGFFAGGALKKKHILSAFKIGLLLSVSIELVQLISKRGVCNIDDVIHNILGCVIGFGCFVFGYKLIRHTA